MKKLILLMTIMLSAASFSKEKDLSDVESIDGFCAMDLIELVSRATQTAPFNQNESDFLNKARTRAADLYRAYMSGHFVEEDEWLEVSQSIYFSGTQDKRRVAGALIEVTNGGDESLLKFYFKIGESGLPRLLVGIHDEQSALAFWACE